MVGRVLLERLFRAADRGVQRAPAARRFRHGAFRRRAARHRQSSQHRGADVQPHRHAFAPHARHGRRLRAASTGGCTTSRSSRTGRSRSSAAAISETSISGRVTRHNFADLDLAVIGPVVSEVSDAFELYWTHRTAVPISTLSRQTTTPEEFAAKRAGLIAHYTAAEQSEYADTVRDSEFARQFQDGAVTYFWGRATIVNDHPDKVLTCFHEDRDAPRAQAARGRRQNGARAVPRVALLRCREEWRGLAGRCAPARSARGRDHQFAGLHELRAGSFGLPALPQGIARSRRRTLRNQADREQPAPAVGRRLVRVEGRSGGSSGASLHAKAFAFDRRIGFVGSYNLDPRSSRLNTEMGVLFDCPPLAKRLPEETESDLAHTAYRVELDGRRLVWVTHEGDTGSALHVRARRQSVEALQGQVLSWLPIEWML